MRQLTRLIRYALPYWWQILSSVLLMAAVGALDAFKYLLVGPVLDRVLNPATGSKQIKLFEIPGTHHPVYLQRFVPSHFTNAWTIVAFALVASTILKGICDYCGTYLVNHAGFGMITDLRDRSVHNVCCAARPLSSPSTRPELCSPPSSTTSSACNMPCRPYCPSFCSSSLPFSP